MSRLDKSSDEQERIHRFLSKPRSRRHPDMLVPNDGQDERDE